MKVAVFNTKYKQEHQQEIFQLLDILEHGSIEYVLNKPLGQALTSNGRNIEGITTYNSTGDLADQQPDFMITLGGDGTILSAMTMIKHQNIPILGINLGRLGFLASTNKSKIKETLDRVLSGDYRIEERSMIHINQPSGIFNEMPHALNDFTIVKRDTSSMIIVHAYLDDEFLNSYWADGLIVSTPTGSTGYSLSCGGPIVFPGSGNFVVTPIAPHNLNVRPIIIPDSAKLRFEIEGRSENFLCTLDARFETITSDQRIYIERSSYVTKLIQLEDVKYMDTIRNKLNWGFDKRN